MRYNFGLYLGILGDDMVNTEKNIVPELTASLNSYRIFLAAAEFGSISAASEQLYISQPAVSRAVMQLENDLGAKLFERTGRGVALTYEGKILYEQVRTAFSALTVGEEKLRRIKELGIGQLKIGASAALCKYMLLPFLKGFVRENPHINISIECRSSAETLKLLRNGQIDAALMVKPENTDGLETISLGEIEDIFIASGAYLDNLVLRDGITGETSEERERQLFASANVMLLDEENLTRQYIDRYFAENDITLNHVIEVSSMDLLMDLAKTGLGIASCVREFAEDMLSSGDVVEVPLRKPIRRRQIVFAALSDSEMPKAIPKVSEKFFKYIAENE